MFSFAHDPGVSKSKKLFVGFATIVGDRFMWMYTLDDTKYVENATEELADAIGKYFFEMCIDPSINYDNASVFDIDWFEPTKDTDMELQVLWEVMRS